MNYLAQGLMSGFGQGFSSFNDRAAKEKEREQREKEIAARALLEREMLDKRLVADAERQFADQSFRSGQAYEDRQYRSAERTDDREFQRAMRLLEGEQQTANLDKRLLADAQRQQSQFQNQQTLAEAQRLFEGDQFQQRLNWDKSPNNPQNISRQAYADRLSAEAAMAGGLPTPGAQFGSLNQAPTAASPEDAAALQWARANPQDPRAAAILKRLGLAQ